MIADGLAAIIARDLRTLRREIEACESEEDPWKRSLEPVANSELASAVRADDSP